MAIHTTHLPRVRQAAPVWQPTLRRSPLRQPRGVVRAGEPSRIARANALALSRVNEMASSSDRRLRATSIFIAGLMSAATLIGLAF